MHLLGDLTADHPLPIQCNSYLQLSAALPQVLQSHRLHAAPLRRLGTACSHQSPRLHPSTTAQQGGWMVSGNTRGHSAYLPVVVPAVP